MPGYRAELTGVFGSPVDDNPTGVIEEAAFAAEGLNYRYLTIKVEKGYLADAITGAKAFGMKGYNLTMPHKIDVIPYLDSLSPAASIIGAVNTVIMEDGKMIGENTDGKGFVMALKDAGSTPKGKNICILGSGGAARAIAVECALEGAASIVIINRNQKRGEELVELINTKTPASSRYLPWDGRPDIPEGTDILINATCVGLAPNVTEKPEINFDTITPDMIVSDVVFNPVAPLFLQECRKHGAKTISGTGMLVRQAGLNFKLWTGEEPPFEVMYDALTAEFV